MCTEVSREIKKRIYISREIQLLLSLHLSCKTFHPLLPPYYYRGRYYYIVNFSLVFHHVPYFPPVILFDPFLI